MHDCIHFFSAKLLIEDKKILEPCGYYEFQELLESETRKHSRSSDQQILFHTQMEFAVTHDTVTTEMISREIGLDPVLIEFKYQALKDKGFLLPVEPNLDSGYLSGLMKKTDENRM